jgi:hypothetical protein
MQWILDTINSIGSWFSKPWWNFSFISFAMDICQGKGLSNILFKHEVTFESFQNLLHISIIKSFFLIVTLKGFLFVVVSFTLEHAIQLSPHEDFMLPFFWVCGAMFLLFTTHPMVTQKLIYYFETPFLYFVLPIINRSFL